MEYFIERVIEFCKFNNPSLQPDEEFLLSTVENVIVAKKTYSMIYNVISRNFPLTITKLSADEKKDITDDLSSKNFWWKDCLTDLDSWIPFYYLYGRFPGSQEFKNVPFVNKPFFLRTATVLLPADLYSKFSGTDAKGLVSLFFHISSFKYLFWRRLHSFENCFCRIYEKFDISSIELRKR